MQFYDELFFSLLNNTMFHAGTASENERRRAQYMLDLKMRADLDDRVLQAVKLNKRTGQSTIPLTDMRTLDEKMQDLERLKSTVRLDLLTITDAANTTEILGGLNTHDLQFVAQKFPLMSAEIKPKYAMGITAAQFFIFMRKYMQVEAAAPVSGRPVGVVDLAEAIRGMPLRADIEEMVRVFEGLGLPEPAILALEHYAAAAPVEPIVGEAYDMDLLVGVADRIGRLPNLEELFDLRMRIDAGDPEAPADAEAMAAEITPERVEALATFTSTPPREGAAEPSSMKAAPKPRATRGDVASRAAKQERTLRLRDESAALGIPVKSHGKFLKLDVMEANIAAKTDALREESAARGLPVRDDFSGTFLSADVLRANIKDSRIMNGESIEGFGIRRMRGRGIASVDDKIALGRYNINTRKLADNIVQLRSAKGGAIHRFPSQQVSAGICSSLRKIIAGGDLSFDDISGLNEEERRYLHDVSTQCGIKTNLPQPKDAVAAQLDRFTILRGQIVSGQDNEDVVKEFKGLLLKMANNNQLPRAQAYQCMQDLLALGK